MFNTILRGQKQFKNILEKAFFYVVQYRPKSCLCVKKWPFLSGKDFFVE
jgi:hypothetical protein